MSIANFWNQQQKQIIFPSMDVNNLEINNVPFNGGGNNTAAGLQQILFYGNDAGGLDAVNFGHLMCKQYCEIGNAISNTSQLHLCYQNGTSSGDNIQLVGSSAGFQVQQYSNNSLIGNGFVVGNDGSCNLSFNGTARVQQLQSNNSYTNGTIFDTNFNKPTLGTVLNISGDANNNSITNLKSISCSSMVVNGENITGGNDQLGSFACFTMPPVYNQTFNNLSPYTLQYNTANYVSTNCFNTQDIVDAFQINGGNGNLTFLLSSSIVMNLCGFLTWSSGQATVSSRTIRIIRSISGQTPQTVYSNSLFVPNGVVLTQSFSCSFVVNANEIITIQLSHTDSAAFISGGMVSITRLT